MDKKTADELWYWYLMGEWRVGPPGKMPLPLQLTNSVFKYIPSDPHCIECGMPRGGIGANPLRFMASKPSSFSSKLGSGCEQLIREQDSGAAVDLTMLFADVRDSTPLAESKGTKAFQELIQRSRKRPVVFWSSIMRWSIV
ncbi:MAG TPA: hypothetical protein VLX61_16290 [Anaerolineales bacterium]|nr:hypothetical protein [Anaerolineales bacterium]